jgi:hypothetical protein
MNENLNIGDKVLVTRNEGSWFFKAIWWPEGDITGDVTKICKNGSVYVAQDWLKNNSEDGKRTRVFMITDNVTISKINK